MLVARGVSDLLAALPACDLGVSHEARRQYRALFYQLLPTGNGISVVDPVWVWKKR